MLAIIPIPRIPITIRPATMEDLSFIDQLQKLHTKQVGWMPEKALIGKIEMGHVLIAEEGRRDGGTEGQSGNAGPSVPLSLRPSVPSAPLGYLIGNDQYFKRDDVGIIYQLAVAQSNRRTLVGATLVKAMFERAAYGCRLFCCWCAQDIEANRFWESLGFIPLAFRAGSAKKSRVHIFWQRRIRAGDTTTPYWFPSQTGSGSIREDRLVFPIPPGTHWSDAKPIILPGAENDEPKQLPTPRNRKASNLQPTPAMRSAARGLFFGAVKSEAPAPKLARATRARVPRKKVKNDPRFVAAARELRDRWLEKVNETPLLSNGKYELSRVPEPCAPRPSLPLIVDRLAG